MKKKRTTPASTLSPKYYHEPEFIAKIKEVQQYITDETGKSGYVNPLDVLEYDALYYIIFGMRSNGKTTAAMLCAAIRYVMYGEPCALIRRWDEDFSGKAVGRFWYVLEKLRVIEYLTNGRYNGVYAYSKQFYFCNIDEKGKRQNAPEPFCYGFALTQMEHDKGGTYPETIGTVIFDEFMTRLSYIPGEFALFANAISTIVRDDGQAKIWMLGNTVSYYCPYFREMGLKHMRTMQPGDISIYTGLHEDCKTVVYYSDGLPQGKKTDKYFAFDNPRLQMITAGKFEFGLWPHCPRDFNPEEIVFSFFLDFDEELLRGDVIRGERDEWIFITPKTTPLKDEDNDLIYSDKDDPRPNWRRKMTKPRTLAERAILELITAEKVFYADNQCGETLRTYLQWCGALVNGRR